MAKIHCATVNKALLTIKPQYDTTQAYMKNLQTKEGEGKFTEISMTDSMCIDYSDWDDWCEMHADDVMGGHPESKGAEVFKKSMIRSLKGMRMGTATMRDGQFVELNYADAAAQFIFGYTAVCANMREVREMHVFVSGFGKKWESAPGHALDKPWWDDNAANVKAFVKYGSLSQVQENLQDFAEEEPVVEEPAVPVAKEPVWRDVTSWVELQAQASSSWRRTGEFGK